MALRRRTIFRLGIIVTAAIVLGNVYQYSATIFHSLTIPLPNLKILPSRETLESLSLTEEQCHIAFPELNREIDDAVARGPFDLEKQPDDYTGLVQARLKDGKLYIITAQHKPNRDMGFERNAVLHALHRAIVTSPTPLPDTIITFSIIDHPHEDAWSFSRSNNPQITAEGNYWVMPHFSFWAWPKPFIGTMDQALSKIDEIEAATTFESKIDKIVWRGTGWFNSVGNRELRPALIRATKGKEWADVETMNWETNGERANNSIPIGDFCKYKYIAYTEGVTYSGRLPFHTACESVVITPAISYLMHTTHLMRPLFSSDIPFSADAKVRSKPDAVWKSYPPSEANIIFVDPEWLDLEPTILWLRENPDIAKGIARKQREMVGERGYLSPAAENCYWRSLIKGWNKVARPVKEQWGDLEKEDGESGGAIRWETFSLTGTTFWE